MVPSSDMSCVRDSLISWLTILLSATWLKLFFFELASRLYRYVSGSLLGDWWLKMETAGLPQHSPSGPGCWVIRQCLAKLWAQPSLQWCLESIPTADGHQVFSKCYLFSEQCWSQSLHWFAWEALCAHCWVGTSCQSTISKIISRTQFRHFQKTLSQSICPFFFTSILQLKQLSKK